MYKQTTDIPTRVVGNGLLFSLTKNLLVCVYVCVLGNGAVGWLKDYLNIRLIMKPGQ